MAKPDPPRKPREAAPADVAVSTDGGRSWKTVRSRAGGGTTNVVTIDVPAAESLRVRIVPADRRLRGAAGFGVPVRAAGGSGP